MTRLNLLRNRQHSSSQEADREADSFPKRTGRFIGTLLLKGMLLFFSVSLLLVLVFKWLPPPTTSWMMQRKIQSLFEEKANTTIHYQWVSYDKISPYVKLAVIASEDQNFPEHFGFDFEAIEKAFSHNEKSRRLRGASTISQQVAKNMFLWPGRNFLRKGIEVYFTLLIETVWGKQRILEMYLNIVEMGDHIFGVPAASEIYFKKSVQTLSREQAVRLAVVLPNPLRYSVKRPSVYLLHRQQWLLQQMRKLGGLSYLETLQ